MMFVLKPKEQYTTGSAEEVAEDVQQIIEDWNDVPASWCHPNVSGAEFEWGGRKHYIPKYCDKEEIIHRLKGEVWTSRDVGALFTLGGILILFFVIIWAVSDLAVWVF